MHPIIKVKYLDGVYFNLFEKLRDDPGRFFNYFRTSNDTFDYILANLIENIRKKNTNFRMAIPPEEMIVVTLR